MTFLPLFFLLMCASFSNNLWGGDSNNFQHFHNFHQLHSTSLGVRTKWKFVAVFIFLIIYQSINTKGRVKKQKKLYFRPTFFQASLKCNFLQLQNSRDGSMKDYLNLILLKVYSIKLLNCSIASGWEHHEIHNLKEIIIAWFWFYIYQI